MRAAILVVLTVGAMIALPASGSVCDDPNQVVERDDWTVAQRPSGLARITSFAVRPHRTHTVFVTDGENVLRTLDRGCTWELVYTTDGSLLELAGVRATVRHIAAPGADGRVYLSIEDPGVRGVVMMPRVMSSTDDGATWTQAGGLPTTGEPRLLRVAPSDANRVYLTVSRALYASEDGGRTFEERSSGSPRDRVSVDPTDANVLWALGSASNSGDGPWRSADGGRTWYRAQNAPGSGSYDGVAASGSVVYLAESESYQRSRRLARVWRSTDGGNAWDELPTPAAPGPFTAMSIAPTGPDDLVVATRGLGFRDPGEVLRLQPAGTWQQLDVLDLGPFDEAVPVEGSPAAWFFRRAETIASYTTPPQPTPAPPAAPGDPPLESPVPSVVNDLPPPPKACLSSGVLVPTDPSRLVRGTLEPVQTTVNAEPGVAARVPYRLSIPAVPGALDVYFLIDTSGSMGSAIDGVVCGLERLVRELSDRGIDVRLGLGEFQDAGALRYRRVIDLAPPGPELQRALRTLRLRGGEEPHRTALYQSATGAGLKSLTGRELVRPGQQASFRDGAYKAVLMITDEPFQVTTTDEPSVPEVVAAMVTRAIHHIGIHIYGGGGGGLDTALVNDTLTRQQMDDFSAGTSTFAPAGGVDCDGDGTADTPAGAPLVCSVRRTGIEAKLSDTLVNVLRAIQEPKTVTLRAAPSEVSVDIKEPTRTVDARSDNALRYDVAFTCATAQAGATLPVRLEAVVADTRVAQAGASIVCGKPPAPPPAPEPSPPPVEPVIVDQPPPVAIVPVPPPPPPLVPASAVTAAQAPAPAAGNAAAQATIAQIVPAPGQTVTVPGLAMAPEKQERLETVGVRTELPFSAVRTSGAAALAFGFGVAIRRRQSVRVARIRR